MVMQKARVPGGWDTPITDWRLHMLGTGRTVATVRLRVDWVRRFARAVEVDPWEVRTAAVIEWSAAHMWARDTRRSALQSVAGFYSWASTIRPVMVDTSALPSVRASAPAPRPADDEAVRRALQSSDWRVHLAVRLASEMGLRRGEVARVRASDIVRDVRGASLIVHGKGGKARTVPMPPGGARSGLDVPRGRRRARVAGMDRPPGHPRAAIRRDDARPSASLCHASI